MVHLVGLDDPGFRVLQRPDHPGQHRRGHLQPGGVLERRQFARLLDREPRAVPERVPRMAVEQHAQLVDPLDDLVLVEDMVPLLDRARTEGLVQRQHGVVAGVVGVVAGRPVVRRRRIAHRVVVGDRDRLVMGDEKAVLRPRRRAPAVHLGDRARPGDPDRGAAARVEAVAVLRLPGLVGAPAEFGRLEALGDETLDRPGVDEGAEPLVARALLGVALGDMDAPDAERLHQPRPAVAVLRHRSALPGIGGQPQQRLLDEPAHHSRIGAAAGDRRRAARVPRLLVAHRLAQRVVGPRRVVPGLEVEPGPGLDHGVDIEHPHLAAEFHQVERRGIDREIDAEAAPLLEDAAEELAVIRLGHRALDMPDAALGEEGVVGDLGLDHHHLARVVVEMPLDQRQGAAPDRAEADHHDRPVDAAVIRIGGHLLGPPRLPPVLAQARAVRHPKAAMNPRRRQ